MENKTIIDSSNAITRDATEYKALVEAMYRAEQTADKLIVKVEPFLFGERYLTTEQVMTYLHISRRTLQNYRDRGIIHYTAIGGTFLYPESKIKEVLEKNYYKPGDGEE
ncbi:MAG: helix-turn-helix domain-containing protein [Bacteroides cellulosilyticus]|nr:helix-turn-helix domain-containing protein [Bacteroides cellulosilyticus]